MLKTKPVIVLVHGFVDFFRILKPFGHGYWRDIPQVIEKAFNVRVLTPELTSGLSPSYMAGELESYLGRSSLDTPVYFIADSMGGLTVRLLLAKDSLDCASRFRVQGVATIGTPHHGTAIADILFGPNCIDRSIIIRLLENLGIEGLAYMTREHVKSFNTTHARCPVKIFSYGGNINRLRFPQFLFTPLMLTSQILNHLEGDNDGLVSVNSAKWGIYVDTISADHAAQIGHFLSYEYFDYRNFYLQIVNKLLVETS